MTHHTILVGVDFSPITNVLLGRARTLAGDGGTIRLVHVVDTTLVPNAAFIDGGLIEECNATLARDAVTRLDECAREPGLAGVAVEKRVLRGRPADVLLEQSRGCSCVVVGAHTRGAVSRALVGSVAEEVARRSAGPVLVVRERAEGGPLERVLLAIDPSEPSPEAIVAAHDVAQRTGARLEAIAVVPWPEAKGQTETQARLRELRSQVIRMGRFHARELVTKAVGEAIPVRVSIGNPAAKILEEARPGDVLVCATHGRGALARLAFGSVATKLSRQARCPVLFIRGPKTSPDVLVPRTASVAP